MKTIKSLLVGLTAFFTLSLGHAQGSFQNLNFELGTLVPILGDPFNRVYFDQAFPGWRGYVGGVQETAAFHNGMFLCCSSIALWGGNTNLNLAIEGSFSARLDAASDPYATNSRPADTAIAQTGVVPVGAQSLLFKASGYTSYESVTLGGQPLSVIPLSTDDSLFGADISAWAGQQTELRFTSIAPTIGDNFLVLDSIEFSTTPIPEPSTFALVSVSAIVAWLFWRRRRR